jgi:hypothetical protein
VIDKDVDVYCDLTKETEICKTCRLRWAFDLAPTLLTSHSKGLTSLLEIYHVWLGVQQGNKTFQYSSILILL